MLCLYFLCFLVWVLLHKGLILTDGTEAQMDGDRKWRWLWGSKMDGDGGRNRTSLNYRGCRGETEGEKLTAVKYSPEWMSGCLKSVLKKLLLSFFSFFNLLSTCCFSYFLYSHFLKHSAFVWYIFPPFILIISSLWFLFFCVFCFIVCGYLVLIIIILPSLVFLSSTEVCSTSHQSAKLEWFQCQGELVATHWWHHRTDWQIRVKGLQQRPARTATCQRRVHG